MSGSQQIVGAGGAGLVVLNFWAGPSRDVIKAGLFDKGATDAQAAAAKGELTKLAAAILFIAVAVILAGVSSTWARGMTSIIVGLGVVWAINKYRS